MPEIPVQALSDFLVAVMSTCGVPREDAATVADTIVDAHQSGKGTHGITRLPIYIRKIRAGLMDPCTPIKVIRKSPIIDVIDASNGFGQVAAMHAISLCLEKAKAFGVGIVGVRHSNNFGVAGYFARHAALHDCIGIVLGNSAPAIAPTGGREPLLGTNPLAIAFPDGMGEVPIVLDMAASEAARGKIRLAVKQGEAIPLGWALDALGQPTTNADEALQGSMVPIGRAKGYGISLAIDILAGLLTGSAFAGQVKPLNHPDKPSDYGHWMMTLNPYFFLDRDEYHERMATFVNSIHSSSSATRVWLPGERAAEARSMAASVVPLSQAAMHSLEELSQKYQIPFEYSLA